jgi:aminopeptidase N
VAHELAHQWWGQAVGWRNYHEQWLSEGFAQYFAALYARESQGEGVFVDMLRQFRRWALAEADEGPISLGYRLGHIKGDSRVFRALVYNKSASVLHMLRRIVGDEVFFRALRRFYAEQRFQKAGTEDLRQVFEAEAGRSFERFFDQWIYGAGIPRIRYATSIGEGGVTVRLEDVTGNAVDLPVTVTLVYADARTEDVIVQMNGSRVEQRLPAKGAVRQVHVNRDFAALAYFDQQR